MKKYFITLVLMLFLLNTVAFPSFAEETVSLKVAFNAGNNEIVVGGVVRHDRDRIPMTLHISRDGKTIAAEETMAVGVTKEGIPFSFPPVRLSVTSLSGNLTITVTAALVNAVAVETYEYVGADKQLQALKTLNEANENTEQFISGMRSTAGVLGVDIQSFDKLWPASVPTMPTEAAIAVRSLMSHNYTLPEDFSTEENCRIIRQAVSEYYNYYHEAMVLGEFFYAKSNASLKEWYDKHKETYGFMTDDTETTEDETKFLSYFDVAIQSDDYLSRRTYMETATNMKELNRLMKQQAVLHAVEISGQYIVRNILTDLPTMLTVNYDTWNSLSDKRQDSVCLEVVGNSYASLSAFSEAVNNAMTASTSTNGGGGGGNSGGNGNGGGKQLSISGDLLSTSLPKIMTFSDLEQVPWANEAIRYLYAEGIISGRDAQTFAPNESVTRAELVKMIVLGMELQALSEEGIKFMDVAPDAWYAEYVSIAAEHGLIKGDEQGNFNPKQPISRQDAATVLYRVLQPSESMEHASFEDYAYISEYARNAVDYMCAKGVINGVGDGKFAPAVPLSRAQAAKILYLTLLL